MVLADALAEVLLSPLGLDIELHPGLWAYRLEDGRFAVSTFNAAGKQVSEDLFTDVKLAVAYYLELAEHAKALNAEVRPRG